MVVRFQPEGYHSVNPYLIVNDGFGVMGVHLEEGTSCLLPIT